MATTYSHFPIRRLLLRSNNCKELSISAVNIIRKEKCRRLFCNPAVTDAVDDEVKKSPRRKRRTMSMEEREEAVKSFVQQYTLMHPGKFPTSSLVREEVGGSWGTLKQILTKLQGNLKGSQDQKQLIDDNGGAFEAAKFVEPENLAINTKSNDAIITDSTNLKQETQVSCETEKLSDVFVHGIEHQASPEPSKEAPVAQSFSAGSSQEQDLSESSREGVVTESAAINLLKVNPKGSLDQKQLTDDNGGAFEAVKFVESENLARNTKSNDAIIRESANLKQEATMSHKKLPDLFAHDSENQASSESSKEGPVAQSFSAASNQKQDPTESSKEGLVTESSAINLRLRSSLELVRKNIQMNAHKGGEYFPSSHRNGLSGTNLPDIHEQTSLESLKEIPMAISATKNLLPMSSTEATREKVEENSCKQASSSGAASSIEKLSSVCKQIKNVEEENLRGFSLVLSSELDGKKVKKNTHNVVDCSVISSIVRELSAAASMAEKLEGDQSTIEGPRQTPDSNHSVHFPKVENGSEKSQNNGFLGRSASRVETNTDSTILERIKQLGQERRKKKVPATHLLVSHNGSDEENEDDSDFSAFDYPEPDGRGRPIIPRTNIRSDTPELPEKPKNQHCVQVMFLPSSATEDNIRKAFNDCGSITEAHIIQSSEHSGFNYASIKFKTEEGFQKALTKKDVVVCGGDVVVEAAFPYNQRLSQDLSPRVKENKSVPFSEIKNIGCTVKIKDLPKGLNFKHLKNALAFCGTVSRVIMDSSNSAVFVEFETEEAKERALMAHWVSVDGKQLQISRVDAPRTPVVRISNVSPETVSRKIMDICEFFGQVKRVHRRDKDIVDVHFKQTELGCMPSILDSLNGVITDQCHWQAQPAPVFPPEMLQALWSSAEGKEYLLSVMQNLCRIISRNCFESDDVDELAAQYYGELTSTTKELQ